MLRDGPFKINIFYVVIHLRMLKDSPFKDNIFML